LKNSVEATSSAMPDLLERELVAGPLPTAFDDQVKRFDVGASRSGAKPPSSPTAVL
jgi:hypothetical protein